MKEQDLSAILAGFHEATRCQAAVWTQADVGRPLMLMAAGPEGTIAAPPLLDALPRGPDPVELNGQGGRQLAARIPPAKHTWLVVGPGGTDGLPLRSYLQFLSPVVTQVLETALEIEHAANELAERYEEINLLYTISEILGRTVRLEEAASTILHEISETVGARRASILVHDRVTDTLQVVAAVGGQPEDAPPISVDDGCSVSARVFRTHHATIVGEPEMPCDAERSYRVGAMLSVPIMWTAPEGGLPLGVVNLSDGAPAIPSTPATRSSSPRSPPRSAPPFRMRAWYGRPSPSSGWSRKCSWRTNCRCDSSPMGESSHRKPKWPPGSCRPTASAATSTTCSDCQPSDRHHDRRRLQPRVSGGADHGPRHECHRRSTPRSSTNPGKTLRALHGVAARGAARTTEMFITVFYGVVDRARGELRYANTGHPHAFVIGADGSVRAAAGARSPTGHGGRRPQGASAPWARARICSCSLPTGSATRAIARTSPRRRGRAGRDSGTSHPSGYGDRRSRVLDVGAAHGDVPARDDLTRSSCAADRQLRWPARDGRVRGRGEAGPPTQTAGPALPARYPRARAIAGALAPTGRHRRGDRPRSGVAHQRTGSSGPGIGGRGVGHRPRGPANGDLRRRSASQDRGGRRARSLARRRRRHR